MVASAQGDSAAPDPSRSPQVRGGRKREFCETLRTASSGMKIVDCPAHDVPEIRAAIGAFDGEPDTGLIVLPDPIFGANLSLIFELVAKEHHPTIYPFRRDGSGRRIVELWHQYIGSGATIGLLCRSDFEGSATRRSAGTSTDQTRVGHQFKDGQGAGPGYPPDASRPR
jgi:hypothetical protein